MIKLLTKNIVGPSSQNIWVQAQTADYDTSHKLVVLLQLKSDDEDSMVDLSVLGSEILLNIEQKSRHIENEAQLKKSFYYLNGSLIPIQSLSLHTFFETSQTNPHSFHNFSCFRDY